MGFKLHLKCKLMQPTRANNTTGRVLLSLLVPALRASGQEELCAKGKEKAAEKYSHGEELPILVQPHRHLPFTPN